VVRSGGHQRQQACALVSPTAISGAPAKSQQTKNSRIPIARTNLWKPVPGDDGAHGRFDSRTHPHSYEVWAVTHKGVLAGTLAVLTGLAIAASGEWDKRQGELRRKLAA
jgi:hypothetical protein